MKTFKYLGSLLTNQNSIQEDIKCGLKVQNSFYYSVQTLLSFRLLSKNLKIIIYETMLSSSRAFENRIYRLKRDEMENALE